VIETRWMSLKSNGKLDRHHDALGRHVDIAGERVPDHFGCSWISLAMKWR